MPLNLVWSLVLVQSLNVKYCVKTGGYGLCIPKFNAVLAYKNSIPKCYDLSPALLLVDGPAVALYKPHNLYAELIYFIILVLLMLMLMHHAANLGSYGKSTHVIDHVQLKSGFSSNLVWRRSMLSR